MRLLSAGKKADSNPDVCRIAEAVIQRSNPQISVGGKVYCSQFFR